MQHGNSYELSAALFLLFYFFLSLVLSHFAFHPEFSFLTISGNKLSDESDQTIAMKGGRQGQARNWQKKSEKYNKRGGEEVRIESDNENIKTGKKRDKRNIETERNIESC